MVVRISELQEETIQTIRGNFSEVDDDDFILSNTSGSIEVDFDDGVDDLDFDADLDDFLNQLNVNGGEVTVVGELDDDDDDLDFDALRITGSNGSVVLQDPLLEDAVRLGEDNDNFVQNTANAVIVDGGVGNDSLTGASGDDFLIGGAGDDLLTGTGGFDTFIVGTGADIIADFEPADVIDLSDSFDDIGQILDTGGVATQVGQDTVIDLGNDESVTLLNFAVDDLSAANFALI